MKSRALLTNFGTNFFSSRWWLCCKIEDQTITHLFLECDFAQILYYKLLDEFGISWCMSRSCSQLLLCCLIGNYRLSGIWSASILAVLWAIWLERNERIFKDVFGHGIRSNFGWLLGFIIQKVLRNLSFLDLIRYLSYYTV